MSNLSKETRDRALKAVSIFTSITTTLSLSGLAYFAAPLAAMAAKPSDFGLTEGDTISAAGSDDPDVYIVNEQGFKRLFLNPVIFGFYGHLGGFANVKNVSPATRDAFPTSGLFRNCETGDQKVYGVETTGEDTGILHWVNTSGAQAVADDPNFFSKVFCINNNEFNWYSKGSDYTSVSQVPNYVRTPGSTPAPTGPLSVSLAPGNPAATTITRNAVGVEYLRFRVSGTGTVNTVSLKRLGPGVVGDFTNVFVYEGARRLTSGKTFSSSDGTATFIVNVAVSGTKDLSVVAEMATAAVGDVNYVQLTDVVATGGVAVSGTPLNGNNFTVSGASSGTVTIAKSGSLSDPTVGQKQAQLSEFKLTTATEGGTVKRLTMINGGTLKPADLTNVKLQTLTGQEWSGTSTSDGYVVFDLGSGHFIAKGGNAVFKVLGDVSGKKDETVDLYFENDADTNVVGDQYGQPMAVTDTALDSASDATTLTLMGGALTLTFVGPSATTVGTTVTDATLLRYTITAASNIEVKKHEFVLCKDDTGNGTYDAAADTTNGWADLTDFKVWDEDLNTVVIGPQDGSTFTTSNSGSCPDSATGAEKQFTDTVDLTAGKVYNYKVTADITADDAGSGVALASGDIIRAILDDYSDDAADVTVLKYAGTNTAVAAADIVPRADISGNNITLTSSSLTLSLAGNPASQTKIRGTKDVDIVGITFAASQASALKITTIKVTGYAAENPAGVLFDEGVATADGGVDTGITVANAVAKVQLYESETGNLVAGSDKVTSNILGTSGTGTMTFSNLDWNIPAGTSKTLLVRADLSNNTASGTAGDGYAFDIAATADVTALDVDSTTVNAGNQKVNGTAAAPTKILTVKNSGSITLATAASSPVAGALYWGQNNAPISKFRLTSTDEAQYIEKLTIAASIAAEATDAAANVKDVILTYKNKDGSTLTTTQSFGNAASVNFAWATTDANRPYIPKDSSLEVGVNVNMKTKSEGATQTTGTTAAKLVQFSLDLVDSFNGSYANGFRAVGEGSGTVIDGTGTNINDVVGAFNQNVYKIFPKIELVALPTPYSLIGTPTVFKFSVTAMGLATANLRFDNEHKGSGSINFEIIASGNSLVSLTTSTTFSVLDETGTTIDGPSALRFINDPSAANTSQTVSFAQNASTGVDPDINSSISFDFTGQDIEIAGGGTRTFSIRLNNPTLHYSNAGTTGRAPDYFQVTLQDDQAGLINWVGDYDGTTNSLQTPSATGVLRSLPLYGPTFQR